MRFDRESWRKLYLYESAEHRLMSVFARGLRDYLLRLASEDGTILSKTLDPKRALVRLLNPGRAEEKAMGRAYDELIAVGYLSFENSRLWITKFADAQLARSLGAARQAKYKEKRQRETDSVTSPGDASVTSQREETRREETRVDPPPQFPTPDRGLGGLGLALPRNRPDVRELHAAWARVFGRDGRSLDLGWTSTDGEVLAARIDAVGLADCLLVAEWAPSDGMVSGRDDDKKNPHESIRYIFGNDDAFTRMLRDAKRNAGNKSGLTVQQKLDRARNLGRET